MSKAKKPRRHQKLTAGRTKVSRHARAVRRRFFAVQMELEFLKANPKHTTPTELASAERRLANVEQQFLKLPKLARQLEVSRATALAALAEEDVDGDYSLEGGD
jgi:hypothetical protein